jgi:aspartate/methionine/tyrosine aminotransferase
VFYPTFKLEEYLAQWEFKAPYLFCSSDAEKWSLQDILKLADDKSLTLWQDLSLGYTETKGLPILRDHIAALYKMLNRNNILCFAGAQDGIFCTMNALLSHEDHVIVIRPCYQSLEDLPRLLQADVTVVELDPRNWELPLDQVKSAFRPNTRLLVLNFPHSPTGAIISHQTLMQLIEMARKCGAYIFCDEVYRLMELNEKDRLPAICDCYERGISLSVMSKAFGLAGLRIGWLACQDKAFLKKAENIKYFTSICNSAPSEVLTVIALKAKDHILTRNLTIMRSNLDLLNAFFQRYPHLFSWILPKGGCTAFPELLLPHSIDTLANDLVQEEGVLILPASVYDYPTNHFRIGFGKKNMPEALERFELFIQRFI